SDQADPVPVALVRSGRWKDVDAQDGALTRSEIEARGVSETEAVSGIGTYVGSCMCVARIPPGVTKRWDYGVVVGYTWLDTTSTGVLHLVFSDGPEDIPFDEDSVMDLAPETYALRPCLHQAVCEVMPREVHALHEVVYKHFNGLGRRSSRKSASILQSAGLTAVDEATSVPLFNIATATVVSVSIKHILDFSYYQSGRRRIPAGVHIGTTIFDCPPTLQNASRPSPSQQTPAVLPPVNDTVSIAEPIPFSMDQLDDSDADDGAAPTTVVPPTVAAPAVLGKRRISELDAAAGDAEFARLLALRETVGANSALAQDIDHLISFKKISRGLNTSGDLAARTFDSSSSFRPTETQRLVHNQLVNGTFATMTAQRLIDIIQIRRADFPFLPHPATARGFYSWDFGFLGLSIMHFGMVTAKSRRDAARTFDMSNKGRAAPPKCPAPDGVSSIISAIDCLTTAVNHAYQYYVTKMLVDLRSFILEVASEGVVSTASEAQELVYWIDGRFEVFRSHLANNNTSVARQISTTFSMTDLSFVCVLQAINRSHLSMITFSTLPSRGGTAASRPRRVQASQPDECQRQPVPSAIVKALPVMKRKRLCMRHISTEGCSGRDGRCTVSYRAHFKPLTLSTAVVDFINERFGGLAASFSDITVEETA
ncbi:hypothetical protein PR002_g27162, partial [Phytophthora rubi]